MLRTFAFGFVAAFAGVTLKRLYDQGKLAGLGEALRGSARRGAAQGETISRKVAAAARARAGLKPAPVPSVSARPKAAPWPADPRAIPQ